MSGRTTLYVNATNDEFKEGCDRQRRLKRALFETTIRRVTSILDSGAGFSCHLPVVGLTLLAILYFVCKRRSANRSKQRQREREGRGEGREHIPKPNAADAASISYCPIPSQLSFARVARSVG